MSDTLFRDFIDALREADYKRSTIELYTTLLKESNVPLNDINAVRAKAKRILAEDFHGDIHRAFLELLDVPRRRRTPRWSRSKPS